MKEYEPQLGDVVDGKATRPIAKDELFSITLEEYEKILRNEDKPIFGDFSTEVVAINSKYCLLEQRIKICIEGDAYNVIDSTLEKLPLMAKLAIQSHRQRINELTELLADERVQTIGLTANVAALKKENEELNSEKVSLANRLWDDQKRVKELEADVAQLKAGWRMDEKSFTINIGDRFRSKRHTITDNEIPVECGAVGTITQLYSDSAFLNFEKCGDVFSNDTIRKDFEKVPAEHPLAELTNVIKYWTSPWTPGVWWNEFDDTPRHFTVFDSAMNYGKGRWVKIEKPHFPPQRDPLEENVKSIIAELSDVDDLTRNVGAIIKKHFADWEPKE